MCKKETNQFNANEILKHILSWFDKLTLAEDWTGWSAEVISNTKCVLISNDYLWHSIGLYRAEDIQCMQATRNSLAGRSWIRPIGTKVRKSLLPMLWSERNVDAEQSVWGQELTPVL